MNRENELVAQARYDSTAFVRLYRRHYDAIFRYCVHRLFERTAAILCLARGNLLTETLRTDRQSHSGR